MEDQKRLLRRSLDNPPVVEAAEAELKGATHPTGQTERALHTRLARLKGNLRKEKPQNELSGLETPASK